MTPEDARIAAGFGASPLWAALVVLLALPAGADTLAQQAEEAVNRVYPPLPGTATARPVCTDEGGSVFLCADRARVPLCYDPQHGGFLDCRQARDHDHERGMRISRALIGGAVDGLSTIIALEENPAAYEGNPLLKSKDRIILAQILHAGIQIGAGELLARKKQHGAAKWASRLTLVAKLLLGAHNLKLAFDGPGSSGDAGPDREP